jgi:predicted AAA+ superfamily ATPase
MIKRQLEQEILECAKQFPVIYLTGPRQSGKTTLTQALFPTYKYVLLEEEEVRVNVAADVKGFLVKALTEHPGIIIDEFQKIPSITSYLQGIVDADRRRNGSVILTGSQNFLMMEQITQTLAGRAAIINLLPPSLAEIKPTSSLPEVLFRGLFPEPYEQDMDTKQVTRWAANYISTYLERDASALIKIHSLPTFQTFLQILATRIGSVVNLNTLASDSKITTEVAQKWLNILEVCFIIYSVRPFYQNFSKSLIKSPKIYFTDTALVCSLLKIKSPADLPDHNMYGALFENLIMIEQIKTCANLGDRSNVYFWRDEQGHEVDIILNYANHVRAVEIKSNPIIKRSFLTGLSELRKIVENYHNPEAYSPNKIRTFVVHGGDDDSALEDTKLISWRHCGTINEN